MALSLRNWCVCSISDCQLSARSPRPALVRKANLPLKAARYNRARPSALLPPAALYRNVAASAVAPAQEAPAAAAASSNGHGAGAGAPAHDNHYEEPSLHPSTLTVHSGENKGRLRQGVADSLTTPIVQTSTYTFKNTAGACGRQGPARSRRPGSLAPMCMPADAATRRGGAAAAVGRV